MTVQFDELRTKTRQTRRKLDQQLGIARKTAMDGKRLQAEIAELKNDIIQYEKASAWLNSMAETKQSTAEQQIEALVTQGLRTVFEQDISFHIVTSKKNNATWKEFVLKSDYNGRIIETSVIGARGSGMIAIVGFLLRIVILLLSSSKQESIVFLDEVFAFVSKEFGQRLAEFVRYLVDNSPIIVVAIMHTHVDEFLEVADKGYKVDLDSLGFTRVVEI